MANFNMRFLSMNFYAIREEYRRYKELYCIFGTSYFTAKEFEQVRKHHTSYLYTLDTYRKSNTISVGYSEVFSVYGTKNKWGDFEICHDITDEIYNALPSQIQDLIIVQQRKRNYYHLDYESYNECQFIYKTLKSLFKE